MSLTQRFYTFRRNTRMEFGQHVAPLLPHPDVLALDQYIQHVNYTRLGHSLDVAYLSFLIAKFLRCDSRSCARAGLLHDMHYRPDDEPNTWARMKSHPVEALENAKSVCDLSPVEEDIILKHMWLISAALPRYKESFIVTFVDKTCAVRERMFGVSKRSRARRRAFVSAGFSKVA